MLKVFACAALLFASTSDAWCFPQSSMRASFSLDVTRQQSRTCARSQNLKMESMSQANSHQDRRRFLQLAAAAAVSQIPLPNFIRPAFAEALKQDASASLLAIPLDVTAAIAGGSPNVCS
jgi:hypothetical protein